MRRKRGSGVLDGFLAAGLVVLAFSLVVGLGAAMAALFQLCWNYGAVEAFGARPISFWSAWALLTLVNLFFLGRISGSQREREK